jgi:hypothetical protein
MSIYHVRVAGSVYGPFTLEQLTQLAQSGRLQPQSEVSLDRISWMPASALLGPAPSHAQTSTKATPLRNTSHSDVRRYLDGLRGSTRYPFYRTTILICSILGYITAALPIIGLTIKVIWFGLSSLEIFEPFAALFATAFIAVFVTVLREMFSMYGDFVDSTLDYHSRHE